MIMMVKVCHKHSDDDTKNNADMLLSNATTVSLFQKAETKQLLVKIGYVSNDKL